MIFKNVCMYVCMLSVLMVGSINADSKTKAGLKASIENQLNVMAESAKVYAKGIADFASMLKKHAAALNEADLKELYKKVDLLANEYQESANKAYETVSKRVTDAF